ncbi:MAG: ATP-binding protein [Pseudonocardiales bacterium]
MATPDPPDLRGYLELAVRGGFPEAVLRVPADLRLDWQDSYLDQLVTRDVETISGGRDPRRLARFVEVYALNTAGVVSDTTIYGAAGVDRRTAAVYEALLASLLVVESIPAWSTNRLKRLVRTPKRYLVDSGLAAGALKIDAAAALRDGNLLGRLLDTFVVAQLRAELPVAIRRPRLYHLRQEGGAHEIDLVVEYPDRTVVGIEVKASAAPRPDSARHLAWFRDMMNSAFRLGVVLHTGSHTYPLGERLVATPISTLWA